MNRLAVYFTGLKEVEVRQEPIPEVYPGSVLVQSECSAISPGTEMLLYRGQAPHDLATDDVIPALAGEMRFPFKYGYASVGVVTEVGEGVDRSWEGQRVFSFNPHETHFLASPSDLIRIPDSLPTEDAVFLANMETAVNFLHDGHPLVGESVAVIGQGVVGLLTTMLLGRIPLAALMTLEPVARRRAVSRSAGAHASFDPSLEGVQNEVLTALRRMSASSGFDLSYEVSGSPEALNLAIGLTGDSGRVIIGSWYGRKQAALDLGGRFHRSRIEFKSSQVSTVDPRLSGRWSKSRRLATALQMLTVAKPAQLITHRFPIGEASLAYDLLDKHPDEAIQVLLEHSTSKSG
ncbi:MAG: oxidoreductase [Chloroflexi bacterium RBG_19FT_COMBO_62_14]|nr:MAG: oxidoreductase [Chloroflexi bacterium RBG_19FT_COMBO_62_14]